MRLSVSQCQAVLPKSRKDLISQPGDLIAEIPVDAESSVIIFESAGRKFLAPVIKSLKDSNQFRRADSEDKFNIKLLNSHSLVGLTSTIKVEQFLPLTQERVIVADQSNQSFVLNEKVIVKWQLQIEDNPAPAKELLLTNSNFPYLPKLIGHIFWNGHLLATANQYILQAEDGWSWCVEKAKNNLGGKWISELAKLTKSMHAALSGKIHGDFHIGQILKQPTSDQLWVIDFEGDPLLNQPENFDRLYDLARMCASFFHVGAVANKYGADLNLVKTWITNSVKQYLELYFGNEEYDLKQLNKLILTTQDRERTYAAKFLPRWAYAPEFAIKFMKELNYGSN